MKKGRLNRKINTLKRFHEVKNVRAMQDIYTDKRGHTRGKAERYTSERKKIRI